MNIEEPLEQIQQRAVELVVELMYQDPELAKFGILISQNIGMQSDQITVLWFYNTQQLVKFLELSLPFSYCSIEATEEIPEEIFEIVREVNIEEKKLLQPDQIELLNSFMNLSAIEWAGTFDEMCEAKGNAEKMMVKWFRQDRSDKSPINPSERDEFKDFLMNNMYQ